MTRDTIEIVRELYAALNAADEGRLEELIDPEIVWVQNPNAPDPRSFHGHDGIRELRAIIDDAFDRVHLEPDELIGVGDRVVVLGRMSAHGKGSGVAVEQERAWIWTIHGEKAVRQETYPDHAAALTAAGVAD